VNWPQNDYWLGNLIDVPEDEAQKHLQRAKQMSLSLLYWMQTEAPRPDGGAGWPGLRLRRDIVGTEDGLAKHPYIRESRRIKAESTVLEQHVGTDPRIQLTGKSREEVTAESFPDSVGIGSYRIDLHPSSDGDNYIDVSSLPFQIPLGALIPQRVENLLPGCKNLGVTHITNGCYRLHPVEWNIGESVGLLTAFALKQKRSPRPNPQSKTGAFRFSKICPRPGSRNRVAEADTPLAKSAAQSKERPHNLRLEFGFLSVRRSCLRFRSLVCTASLISSLSASAAIQRAEVESSF
jgi:hypothetical protein